MLLYKPWRRRIDRKRQIRQPTQRFEACEEAGIAMEAQLNSEKEKIAIADRNVEEAVIATTDLSTPPTDQIHALGPRTSNF